MRKSHKKIKERSKLGDSKLKKIIEDLSEQTEDVLFEDKIKTACRMLQQFDVYLEPRRLKEMIIEKSKKKEEIS